MIPRVRIGSQSQDYPGPLDGRPLFVQERPLRQIRVLVDAHLLDEPDPVSRRGLLAGLLTHELVELYRYADVGPPADVPLVEAPYEGVAGKWYSGWAVLGPADPADQGRTVFWTQGTSLSEGAIWGNAAQVAAIDTRTHAYGDLPADQAAKRREADVLAAQVAERLQADIFITERPYLHAVTWSLASNVTFLTPEEMLPFLSLYLRTQGEFLIWKFAGGRATFNRGLFYWVGARELLSQAWRWWNACRQYDQNAGQARLVLLAQTTLQRVERALELRDRVHRALNQPQDNDVADDALLAFDSCLIFLMGALDAVARLTHLALGLPGRPRDAGWQKDGWVRALKKVDAGLAAVVAKGSSGNAVLVLLTTLRNTVHSVGLSSVAASSRPLQRERTLIDLSSGVDANDMPAVLAAIDMLGGGDDWGIESLIPQRYFVDPGTLLERLLVPTLQLLNDLMAATPVETWPGVSLTAADYQPPEDRDGTLDERTRRSIRWQLGL